MVEHAGYTNEFSSEPTKRSYQLANIELKKAYDALQKEAIPQIYYLTKEEIGLSMDAAVEGVHPNDLGMQQYADGYIRKIREILHEKVRVRLLVFPVNSTEIPMTGTTDMKPFFN